MAPPMQAPWMPTSTGQRQVSINWKALCIWDNLSLNSRDVLAWSFSDWRLMMAGAVCLTFG
jgi:hypothetical protein